MIKKYFDAEDRWTLTKYVYRKGILNFESQGQNSSERGGGANYETVKKSVSIKMLFSCYCSRNVILTLNVIYNDI